MSNELLALTEDEKQALNHWSMWGSDGYPVQKRGSRWWVDGYRGLGACPSGFKTRKAAHAQWSSYVNTLLERAGAEAQRRALGEASARSA